MVVLAELFIDAFLREILPGPAQCEFIFYENI